MKHQYAWGALRPDGTLCGLSFTRTYPDAMKLKTVRLDPCAPDAPSAAECADRIAKTVAIAIRLGGSDGAHHKAWVIDQMLRLLLADKYDETIKASLAGEDGPNTYEHDVGIAP